MIRVKSCVCVFEMFLFTEPANHFHDRTWHSGITAVFLDCRRTDNSPGLGLGNKEIWQQSHSKECHKSTIWLNKSMVDKMIQMCHMIQNFMTKLYDLYHCLIRSTHLNIIKRTLTKEVSLNLEGIKCYESDLIITHPTHVFNQMTWVLLQCSLADGSVIGTLNLVSITKEFHLEE